MSPAPRVARVTGLGPFERVNSSNLGVDGPLLAGDHRRQCLACLHPHRDRHLRDGLGVTGFPRLADDGTVLGRERRGGDRSPDAVCVPGGDDQVAALD